MTGRPASSAAARQWTNCWHWSWGFNAHARHGAAWTSRHGTTAISSPGGHGARVWGLKVEPPLSTTLFQEISMPIIAWLLGVPLSVVLLLMLFGVF